MVVQGLERLVLAAVDALARLFGTAQATTLLYAAALMQTEEDMVDRASHKEQCVAAEMVFATYSQAAMQSMRSVFAGALMACWAVVTPPHSRLHTPRFREGGHPGKPHPSAMVHVLEAECVLQHLPMASLSVGWEE